MFSLPYTGFHSVEKLKSVKNSLEGLAIPGNGISSLTFDDLYAMKTLYAYNNELTELTFNGNCALQHIAINRNQLTDIPHLACMKSTLKTLHIDKNKLIAVCNDSWTDFPKLKDSDLHENSLSLFPCSAVQGTQLTLFNLNANKFAELPRLDCVSASLKELNLTSNRINVVNNSSLKHLSLTRLGLASNDISTIEEVTLLYNVT